MAVSPALPVLWRTKLRSTIPGVDHERQVAHCVESGLTKGLRYPADPPTIEEIGLNATAPSCHGIERRPQPFAQPGRGKACAGFLSASRQASTAGVAT